MRLRAVSKMAAVRLRLRAVRKIAVVRLRLRAVWLWRCRLRAAGGVPLLGLGRLGWGGLGIVDGVVGRLVARDPPRGARRHFGPRVPLRRLGLSMAWLCRGGWAGQGYGWALAQYPPGHKRSGVWRN